MGRGSRNPSPPLAPGSIALGLHPHDAAPAEALRMLTRQARCAERAGFDGVTLSEHHGGEPGYLPTPQVIAGWLLDDLEAAWAVALPLLLPLRTAATVAEDVAWLAQRHPGRVALGLAPGYRDDELALAGVTPSERASVYARGLAVVAAALRGNASGLLGDDPAVRACAATPVPVVSAVGSGAAARRAAACGAGMLLGGSTSMARLQRFVHHYREAQGSGPVVLIRRVWVGDDPPHAALESLYERYHTAAGGSASWIDSAGGFCWGAPRAIADRLADDVTRAGADALNLRVHLPGLEPAVMTEQIRRVGDDVLPLLRSSWSWTRQHVQAEGKREA